ncbi:MAG: tRNA pseudouridine(13) synthase TruD [Fuerstiella sp.]|nr:tRNA pseudouridine(13) synthase TruD [Fuerstiella sp.]
MKLKCRPDDFVVTEKLNVRPTGGPWALYHLNKTNIGTLEAIQQISRVWNLPLNRIAHAGLKDRHAVTQQSITIRNGPPADLQKEHFCVEYQGQTDSELTAANLLSNRFQITIRRVTSEHASETVRRVTDPTGFIVPNYFDEQRFGSLGTSGDYIAVAWCRKDYERATWLALADPNRHDRSADKTQKQILRDQWGNWKACKQQLNRSHRRSIVTYLVDHPDNFRKAFALIRPYLRGFYLSAFQSAVWNRMLGHMIQQLPISLATTTIADAQLPFGNLTSEMISDVDTTIPLISARSRLVSEKEIIRADAASAHYGLRPDQMKVAYPRDRFFSKGIRQCWVSPASPSAHIQPDDLYPGYQCVCLDFQLPPGCYATMLIRGLSESQQSDQP